MDLPVSMQEFLHTLQEAEDEGHTHAERRKLALNAANLLEADATDVENRIDALMNEEEMITSKADWVQNPISARAEETMVRCLKNQSQAASSLPAIQVEKAIAWAQEKAGFSFADQQAEAVRQALQSKISILTGGPGTGKTTILRALVSILRAKKTKMLLAAPTGRAARRMAESCSHLLRLFIGYSNLIRVRVASPKMNRIH